MLTDTCPEYCCGYRGKYKNVLKSLYRPFAHFTLLSAQVKDKGVAWVLFTIW